MMRVRIFKDQDDVWMVVGKYPNGAPSAMYWEFLTFREAVDNLTDLTPDSFGGPIR